MPRPLIPGELHSYGDWQALGYQVQRGQHAAVPRNGDSPALFSDAQVRPRSNNTMAHQQGFQQAPRRRARVVVNTAPTQPAEPEVVFEPTRWEQYADWMVTTMSPPVRSFATYYNSSPAFVAATPTAPPAESLTFEAAVEREQRYIAALNEKSKIERELRASMNELAKLETPRPYVPEEARDHEGLRLLAEAESRIRRSST